MISKHFEKWPYIGMLKSMKSNFCSSLLDPNIVFIYGLRIEPLGLIMEFAEFGTLRDIISSSTSVDINKWRISLCLGVANGMHYLHSHEPPILHRDLKTTNVLVCKDNNGHPIAKVCNYLHLVNGIDCRLWDLFCKQGHSKRRVHHNIISICSSTRNN